MATLEVGPEAKKHIASLNKEVVRLTYGPRIGFHIGHHAALFTRKNRNLQVGVLAKLRLKALRHKAVTVHWSEKGGFTVKTTPAGRLSKRQVAIRYAFDSLEFAGRMVYCDPDREVTDGHIRSELFFRKPGDFLDAGADCSQFVSAIMHWSDIENVNQFDATGSLLAKGKEVSKPAIARLIIAGAGGGVHCGMFVEKVKGEWQIIEFGKQAAPDLISESAFVDYFKSIGVDTFRYRDFYE